MIDEEERIMEIAERIAIEDKKAEGFYELTEKEQAEVFRDAEIEYAEEQQERYDDMREDFEFQKGFKGIENA